MFLGSSGSGFFSICGVAGADGFEESPAAGGLFGPGFANRVPAASKPVRRRQIRLSIGKGTSKRSRCPMAKQRNGGMRNAECGVRNGECGVRNGEGESAERGM